LIYHYRHKKRAKSLSGNADRCHQYVTKSYLLSGKCKKPPDKCPGVFCIAFSNREVTFVSHNCFDLERTGAGHGTQLFDGVGVHTIVVDILHVLEDLENLKESMPVGIVGTVHGRTLAGPATGMVPEIVHEFLTQGGNVSRVPEDRLIELNEEMNGLKEQQMLVAGLV
jgi:NAD-dependent DNA ligase